MYPFYKKDPMGFTLTWIGIYCVIQSLSNGISAMIGIPKSANALLALAQSVWMLWWLHRHGLMKTFYLNKPTQSAGTMLFYLPLLLISTANLWQGVRMNLTPAELGFHILLMLCVGFLEELIFRGFLFEALCQKSMKTAVIVSSLTFGAGHIVNLFNGSGMAPGRVLLQIAFAVLFGFLFVMVYLRSGSLIPCILSHQTINILSAFANYEGSRAGSITANLIEAAVTVLYLIVLIKAPSLRSGTAPSRDSAS